LNNVDYGIIWLRFSKGDGGFLIREYAGNGSVKEWKVRSFVRSLPLFVRSFVGSFVRCDNTTTNVVVVIDRIGINFVVCCGFTCCCVAASLRRDARRALGCTHTAMKLLRNAAVLRDCSDAVEMLQWLRW